MRYPFGIKTQQGESETMDSPFSFSQIRIFRVFGLTSDLKIRYGSDIHSVSAIISFNLIFGSFSMYRYRVEFNILTRNALI